MPGLGALVGLAVRGGGARAASVAAARSAGRASRLATRGGAFTRAAKAPKGGIRGLKRAGLLGGALGGMGGGGGAGAGGSTSAIGGASGAFGVFGLGGPSKGTKINLPPTVAPKATSRVSSPSISTITEQLTLLISIAKDIGANIDEQKASLVSEIKDANRMAEADQLDAKSTDASPIGEDGEVLGPDLSSPLNDFSSALDNLIEAIKGINLGGGGGGPGGSLLGGIGGAAAAVAGTAGAAVAGRAIAARAGGRAGGRAAARGGAQVLNSGLVRRNIARIAGPLLAKRLGGTALRSIPILGTALGVGFAVNSLLKGDLVGAGLNLTSGIAGPVTAIPAMILQLAREVYSGVYGANPESDPLVGERMAVIVKELEKMAAAALTPRVRRQNNAPAPASTRTSSGATAAPARAATRTAAPVSTSSGGGSPQNRVAPGVNERAAAQAGSATAAPAAAAATAISSPSPGAMSAPSEPAAPEGPSSDGVVESPSISVPSPQQLMNSNPSVSGGDIIRASDNADPMLSGVSAASGTYSLPGTRVGPARQSTTRQGMVGVGNVPSPDYQFAGDIAAQLYFAEAA